MKRTWHILRSLVLTGFIFPLAAQAVPPPAPTNVRAIILPAEVLLTWDASPGADSYKVYRGGPNRRWILPAVAREPRFRDTEFTELPSYYQLSACNAAGECLSTAEFLVYPATNDLRLIGATPRPLSDTSFAVAWTIGGAAGLGLGEGMLEVGTSLDAMTLVGKSQSPAWRHEFAAGNLLPSTTYFYRLTSWGANGGGFTYAEKFTTRPFTQPPPAMVRLTDPAPALSTDEDMPVDFTLTADNPSGGPLEFFVSNVPFGTLWGTAPNFTYLSSPEHSGVDFFDCGYTDGMVTHYARVQVGIRFVQEPPIALDQSVTFIEDTPRKFFVSSRTWDVDPSTVRYVILSGPTNGVLRTNEPWLARGEYQYEPATNFSGIDHVTFAAYDSHSTGNVATVRLRVSPVNDRPIASAQSVTLPSGSTTRITLTASDPDREYLNFNWVSPPAHGSMVWSGYGTVDYTPAVGFVGADSFSYRVTDPSGLDATATVLITVVQPNRPPVAESASLFTEYGVPLNLTLMGSDLDGDPLTFSVLSQPTGGTLSGTPPNLVFTPAPGFSGLTGFIFKANDGAHDSPVATNLITVGSATVPPNAPSGLTATAVSRSQINLSWTDNSGRETGFAIERSNDNKKWSQIGVVGANVTSFASVKLTDRKTYYYRVRAFNSNANSTYSNVASATTPR
jgi:hypothetical protein